MLGGRIFRVTRSRDARIHVSNISSGIYAFLRNSTYLPK
ncbi:hypothetical protein CSIRO_0340 [Bradyrhizobiaceae bacterium SG-6C]|nr:hypothetical protein CSIRO_0340 [Bradyrhizobiaceae bacterium SG-6C]